MNLVSIMAAVGGYSQVSALNRESGWDVFWAIIREMFTLEDVYLQTITQLLYAVGSWMMAIVDFIFVLIRQLCGINTDFSSLSSVVEDDAIFSFFFDEGVVEIIRNLIILAIVIILVFGIIAIIKNEFNAIKDVNNTGKIDNNKSGIWKNIFTSLLLLFLIPMILFGGIIISNGVLQSLYNVTSGAVNNSVGTQIFVASAYDANLFRKYATVNKKIPITYSFKQVEDYSAITDWDSSGSVKEIGEALSELKQLSVWKQGWVTFQMFYERTFFDMDLIDYYEFNDPNNAYNAVFDKNIRTYTYEYFVNADLIDYMMQTGKKVYYLTAQEVYDSCLKANDPVAMSWGYGSESKLLKFSIDYDDDSDPVEYSHQKDTFDESKGSVFIACVQDYYKATEDGKEVEKPYFRPIDYAHDKFSSLYLKKDNQFVVARGLFDSSKYPTAIRKVDGVVEFYRDRMNIPTYASFFPRISYELPEGVTEEVSTRVLKKVVEYVSGVDLNDFVPYVYFDFDIMNLFTKSTKVIDKLPDAGYSLNYVFAIEGQGIIQQVLNIDNTNMKKTYSNLDINYVVLYLATIIILRKLLYALIGIIRRLVDIMFLYIMYPAAVATIPLYGNSSLGKWTKNMFAKVTSMYGLILGINIGLLLVPLSSSITLFTPEMFASTHFGLFANKYGVFLFNKIIQVLFFLVGFNFIFEIPAVVQRYVENVSVKDYQKAQKEKKAKQRKANGSIQDIVGQGEDVVADAQKVVKSAADFVSGRTLMNAAQSALEYIPGSAIVKDIKEKRDNMTLNKMAKQSQANAKTELKANMANGGEELSQANAKQSQANAKTELKANMANGGEELKKPKKE